jgi:hypothetical protein
MDLNSLETHGGGFPAHNSGIENPVNRIIQSATSPLCIKINITQEITDSNKVLIEME